MSVSRDWETLKMWSRETVRRNRIEAAETENLSNSQKCLITLHIVGWVINDAVVVVLHVSIVFSNFSGLKINFEKTHAVWIGLKKYSSASIKTKWKLCWGKTDFKLLGIIFNVNLDQILFVNYTDKLQKIRHLIKLWKRRYLTPLGKITVTKTLLLPILNHLLISIPNPNDQILKELKSIFFEFLWEGPAKIKQTVVIKQYCEGGLRMINLKAFMNSMKFNLVKKNYYN